MWEEAIIMSILGKEDVVHLEEVPLRGRLDVCFKGVNNIAYSQKIQNELSKIKVNLVPKPLFSLEIRFY